MLITCHRFMSGLDLAIRYKPLDQKARAAVWETSLRRAQEREAIDSIAWTSHNYVELSLHALNGHEINRSTRNARVLAASQNEMLTLEHVQRAVSVLLSFNRSERASPGPASSLYT